MHAESVAAEGPNRRDALIEEYRSYVGYVVGYLIQSMHLPADHSDEFKAAGYLGLVEAAERFDFDCGKSFKNFAFLRIRGAIIDSIRECSDLSGKAYHYAKALRAAHDLRETATAEPESESPSDASREASLAKLFDFASTSVLTFRLSLSVVQETLSTEGGYGECPEVEFLSREKIRKLHELIATLPKQERLVVEGYYFNGKSFVDIGKELGGLSKSWVSRLHLKATRRLLDAFSQLEGEGS